MDLREINEAKKLIRKGLRAWIRRDWDTVYDCLQLTHKEITSPEEIREKVKYGYTFAGWIGKPYVISDCAIDFNVTTLTTKKGMLRFRLRMIKESGAYQPSKNGTWGASVMSMYNSIEAPKDMKSRITKELNELGQEMLRLSKSDDQDGFWNLMSEQFRKITDKAEYFQTRQIRQILDYKMTKLEIITPDVVDATAMVTVQILGEVVEIKDVARVTKEQDSNGAYGWKVNPYTYSNGLINHAELRKAFSEATGSEHTPA